MTTRKIFVLDTSVLLYDKTSIHSFPGNDVVIPLKVLDELDRFKDKPNLVGENARYINRYLDNLRQIGQLDKSVVIEGSDQTIRIEIHTQENELIPTSLDARSADNIILGTALYLANTQDARPLIVVTKDINLRVKCDALGLAAEDYYKDHVEVAESGFYEGVGSIQLNNEQLEKLFKDGSVEVSSPDLLENQLIIGTGPAGQSALAIKRDTHLRNMGNPENHLSTVIKLQPRNKEQSFALWLLSEPSIPLVSITGIAGSGKTFLTLMAGLAALIDGKYERIVITRSIEPVGRDLGYLPGSLDEKIRPWLAPMMDNVRHAFKDVTYFQCMIDKGQIEIAPLAYIRGRTFNNAFIIVDEAQNATVHELKTIITRVGKDSKIVLLGDVEQVDTPYIDSRSNGLTITVEKFKGHRLTGHINLKKGQRSDLASAAADIL